MSRLVSRLFRPVGLLLVILALVATALGCSAEGTDDRAPGKADPSAVVEGPLDSDDDGLLDDVETAGWQTARGDTYTTDPHNPDTDGDGLTDSEEAGPLSDGADAGDEIYTGLSDPTEVDSDGDGLDDATEHDGGFDPWAKDPDDDGLDDLEEIEFGSDPLAANVDGDHLDDAEELREGSDPNLYDLTRGMASAAFVQGAAFGDWEAGARNIGRLNDQQLDSWQYLAGSIAGGFVVVGDARDVIANLSSLEWTAALVSLAAAIPVLGDGAKVTDAALAFAKKGGRATHAAMSFVAMNPALSDGLKVDLTRKIVRLDLAKARLSQDAAVRGKPAPAPLSPGRPISKDGVQNKLKDEMVRRLQSEGYTDIRVNQQQVDTDGMRVGINRPDIQATAPDGTRHTWEYDTESSDRGPAHRSRILSNDDDAEVCLLSEKDGYDECT